MKQFPSLLSLPLPRVHIAKGYTLGCDKIWAMLYVTYLSFSAMRNLHSLLSFLSCTTSPSREVYWTDPKFNLILSISFG
jgi:hypothetical protein